MKTSEMIGPALDRAVTYALHGKTAYYIFRHNPGFHRYSTDWAQGGPIIEREQICTKRQSPCSVGYEWNAWIWTKHIAKGGSIMGGSGPTPLIAAMRCYVASKLGDEVEVPDELCLRPCHSPYCECEVGKCTHPGYFDARGTTP